MKKTLFLSIILIFLISIIASALGVLYYSQMEDDNESQEIQSFEECEEADGKMFLEEVDEDEIESDTQTEDEYYGSSTYASCEVDSDCVVNGCNSEICAGKDEEQRVSICLFPEQPLPSDLGYSCGCSQNKCQWSK